ncbi:MAG: ABC transporter ATP-binding protein [Coriobacteriia bacterium]|nr:ABC transporter ATP-binding protein [Coriobacteriia bacterium]
MSGILRYEGADVGYADAVVRGASLDVAAGEIVGLVGPNGAGKTTLVRSVTGGARILGGAITVDGREVGGYSRLELARMVAVLPQTVAASFSFSARQFVEMGRHAHVSRFGGLAAADRAVVDRALELTDTGRLAEQAVDTLSGGDLQRLTLAQALAQEPSVLLLDEPTSHLDLNHRLQVLDLIRSLADDGLAVLAVFHDLDMAARYADRLAVVHDGRLEAAAAPDAVLTGEALARVFGVAAVIGTDPVTGAVQVLPVVRTKDRSESTRAKVVVISGSGTGAAIMRRLVLAGFDVAAGALAVGDTDHKVADALGLAYTPLEPYGAMSDEQERIVEKACRDADVVVVAATPFGTANVGNLRAAARVGERVVLVGELTPEMDFTRCQAANLWEHLSRTGSLSCPDQRDVIRCVEEVASR